MMALIETKYSVGDVVFLAATNRESRRHKCPDCNDTRVWKAISPAGTEYEFGCPRCGTNYLADHELAIAYIAHAPAVTAMTVGSVQHNTWSWEGQAKTQYMCRETGVGSGSVYDEAQLYATQEAAQAAANALAAERNRTDKYVVKLFDKTLSISDYQLSDARTVLAKQREQKAHALLWNVDYALSNVVDAVTLDEAKDAVEDYRAHEFERDRQALREAILAELKPASEAEAAAHA